MYWFCQPQKSDLFLYFWHMLCTLTHAQSMARHSLLHGLVLRYRPPTFTHCPLLLNYKQSMHIISSIQIKYDLLKTVCMIIWHYKCNIVDNKPISILFAKSWSLLNLQASWIMQKCIQGRCYNRRDNENTSNCYLHTDKIWIPVTYWNINTEKLLFYLSEFSLCCLVSLMWL